MKKLCAAAAACLLFAACKTTQPLPGAGASPEHAAAPEPETYRAANTRLSDILHQELRVSFDWDKQYLYGQSTLDIRPYFYPTDRLFLDARGMDLHEVSLVRDGAKTPLAYAYENDSLKITLDKTYGPADTYRVFIDYTARPEELGKVGGSAAITSDKGLYFINPDGSDPHKPRQLWTQGETQANSVWFPTIDSPNERFTQEIYMTVDTGLVTLSNGVLLSSITNESEGTRTDYWKQTLPAAPYLTMMAVGDFRVVKDGWRGKEVSYYVDPDYEPYARAIFGHTPAMMEFFSTRLGVDFPWDKYGQVVVHDYVSGAMENASATLHGEFLQRDARALLDHTNEDVISHELFHQWFGDLVTCESWSNVPLNESFATYGEYLWNEHYYGREEADFYGQLDQDVYLRQAGNNDAPLVRYDYDQQEEIFDRITYQKGGRILHMLRKYLGDDAFFQGLKTYLTDNRLQPVEVHQLRLAMEKVSGRDLNWFFNQWFFAGGHPVLDISSRYIDSLHTTAVTIEQKQDFEKNPLYRLPLQIDLYAPGGVRHEQVDCRRAKEVFLFTTETKPLLVNVDAEKMLVCTKDDHKADAAWIYMFRHAPLFLDRDEALAALGKSYEPGDAAAAVVTEALADPFWGIRLHALKYVGKLAKDESTKARMRTVLEKLVRDDVKAGVREGALKALARYYDDPALVDLYAATAADSSYDVMGRALINIVEKDEARGLKLVEGYESTTNKNIRKIVATIYTSHAADDKNQFMAGVLQEASGGDRYVAATGYGQFLTRCRPATIEQGAVLLENVARNDHLWFVRLAGTQALSVLISHCKKQAEENKQDATLAGRYTKIRESIEAQLKAIKAAETDDNLKRIYGE